MGAECEMLPTNEVTCIDDRREEEGGVNGGNLGYLYLALATGSKSVIRQRPGRQPPLRPPTSPSFGQRIGLARGAAGAQS